MEFDLDGNPVDPRSRPVFLARFIHAEIYRVRPDLHSVIHSHSPSVIPFGIAQTPLPRDLPHRSPARPGWVGSRLSGLDVTRSLVPNRPPRRRGAL
ncbi:class II aldolase/adducin family protein [Methylobacterium nodulans]|uniref:class II aldolase/adducin family protein n=1 Tax=Methylobacterium nodulans TaxID=114616 RepID=UPI000A034176